MDEFEDFEPMEPSDDFDIYAGANWQGDEDMPDPFDYQEAYIGLGDFDSEAAERYDRDDPRVEQAEADALDPDPTGEQADHQADVEEQRMDRQWDR